MGPRSPRVLSHYRETYIIPAALSPDRPWLPDLCHGAVAAAGGRARAGGAGHYRPAPARRRPDFLAEHADPADAHDAELSAGGDADDDGLYPHHHCAGVVAQCAGNRRRAAQPDPGGPGLVSYLFYHGTGVRPGLRRRLPPSGGWRDLV